MGVLNARQVETAKPGDNGKDVYLRDGDGLELRIMPAGKRIWQYRYQFEGKRKVIALGGADFVSLKNARKLAHEARELIDRGVCPKAHKEEERTKEQARIEQARLDIENRRTFKKTFDEWILTIRRKDGGTELVRTFEKDVFPYLADKTLLDIKKSDLLSLLDRVVNRGARVLANHLFADMKQFFTWCENRELIDKHPLRGLKKTDIGGTQRERDRVLSTAELIQLRDKLPAAHMERQTEIAIWLMLSTLARVGELSQARWEHIDLESGTWTIPAGNSKNAKEHTIFLSGFATRYFAELHSITRDSGWMFPSSRQGVVGHICLRSISKQIKDRQRETALTNRSLKGLGALVLPGGGWTAHDLRRTGATLMGELGVSSEVIERCLNHIEISKLKRTYQRHELRAERREAWQRLGEQLDALLYDKERTVIPMLRRVG